MTIDLANPDEACEIAEREGWEAFFRGEEAPRIPPGIDADLRLCLGVAWWLGWMAAEGDFEPPSS